MCLFLSFSSPWITSREAKGPYGHVEIFFKFFWCHENIFRSYGIPIKIDHENF